MTEDALATMTTKNLRRIVIVGGTSAMAIASVKLWLHEQPSEVLLIGRDSTRLARVENDLSIRFPASRIGHLETDLCDTRAIACTVDQACIQAGPEIVLIAHGSLPDQVACEQDIDVCHDALTVNGVSPALWAEAFTSRMMDIPGARLILVGSVAGDRGRQSNYAYGAAKGLLARYAQGLQHRLALKRNPLKVVMVKPGPTATPMTAHLTAQGQHMAPVDEVARCIVRGAEKGASVVYAPGKWRIIMLVIRHLPSAVFHRLKI